MIKRGVLFTLGLLVCLVKTKPSFSCGEIPYSIYRCVNGPKVFANGTDIVKAAKCSGNECEIVTCVYRNMGWMDGIKVITQNVGEYIDKFADDHPEWNKAVQHIKTTCLGEQLLPQGIYIDCPAFDNLFCIYASFIKNATPSQWRSTVNCKEARQYAAACPACPNDCFAVAVPAGSCNACYLTPSSKA